MHTGVIVIQPVELTEVSCDITTNLTQGFTFMSPSMRAIAVQGEDHVYRNNQTSAGILGSLDLCIGISEFRKDRTSCQIMLGNESFQSPPEMLN